MKPKIPDEILSQWQSLVEIMAEIIEVPSAIITRVEMPLIEVLKASRNPENPYKEGIKVELANHYCEYVVMNKERMLLPDARKSERWKNAPEIAYGIYSYLGYPLCWPTGEMFGTLCVLDSKENPFERYEKLMEQFRHLVEAHLSLVFQKKEMQEQKEELERKQHEIHELRHIIPICAHCKKIRNDEGFWEQVESYIAHHSDADLSHGICPVCAEKYYGRSEKGYFLV